MRIITGKYKKANLVTVKNRKTRPTTDFLKEVMFSVVGNCEDSNVLDLYAGSGALGLEALSRGASQATFVDSSEGALKAVMANVQKLRCSADCRIHKKRVSPFIKNCESSFDLIFMDPPYNIGLINGTLDLIFEKEILAENGEIVIERSKEENLLPKWQDMIIYDKVYGSSMITVLSKNR